MKMRFLALSLAAIFISLSNCVQPASSQQIPTLLPVSLHQPTTKLSTTHVISYKCDICKRSEDFVEINEKEHDCTGTTEKKHPSHRMHKYAEKDVPQKLD